MTHIKFRSIKQILLYSMLIKALLVPLNLSGQWDPDWLVPEGVDTIVNPYAGDAFATERGEKLFKAICYLCHGERGVGDGIQAASLEIQPADLTSDRVQRQSDGTLFWKISEGNPPMLRFKDALSEEKRWQIINYVRQLPKLYGANAAERLLVDNTVEVTNEGDNENSSVDNSDDEKNVQDNEMSNEIDMISNNYTLLTKEEVSVVPGSITKLTSFEYSMIIILFTGALVILAAIFTMYSVINTLKSHL